MMIYFDPKLNTEAIYAASPYGLSAILTQYCEDEKFSIFKFIFWKNILK